MNPWRFLGYLWAFVLGAIFMLLVFKFASLDVCINALLD
jgi:hypothetical protein